MTTERQGRHELKIDPGSTIEGLAHEILSMRDWPTNEWLLRLGPAMAGGVSVELARRVNEYEGWQFMDRWRAARRAIGRSGKSRATDH